MNDGPLKSALDNLSSQGVIRRELVTYKMKSGKMIRETVCREYRSDGDILIILFLLLLMEEAQYEST